MRYLLRKVVLYVFIAWAAITMNFLIPRLMPGDPVSLLVDRVQGRVDPEAIAALRGGVGRSGAHRETPELADIGAHDPGGF
jgi:peptide/nickel transport system permease protein